MDWPGLWYGTSWGARATRLALAPLSGLYALGWSAYLGVYRLGLKRAAQPFSPVICVGNLAVGGSGKTPFTLFLGDLLERQGYAVVISASGYGSPRSEAASLAPEGELDPAEWGDEPALYRWKRPHWPLIVGRRRVLAAGLAATHFPGSILLMDDGFQHLPLHKDVSLVLDPPSSNRWCLPAGPYREPISSCARASLVLPNDRFQIAEISLPFLTPAGEEVDGSGEVDVLCALGRPDRFLEALRKRVTVCETHLFPDHHPLDGPVPSGERPLVVTAKDWVKLRKQNLNREVWIAQHAVHVEPAPEFEAWLAGILPTPRQR